MSEPLQRRDVAAIVAIVLLTLTTAAFIYAMQASIAGKADSSEVAAISNEVRDIRSLLCDTPENMMKQACKRSRADYAT